MRLTTLSLCSLTCAVGCGLAILGCTSEPIAASVPSARALGKLGGTYSFTIGANNRDPMVGDAFTASNAVANDTLSRIRAVGTTTGSLVTPGGTFIYIRDISNNLWWAAPHGGVTGPIRSI